MSFPLRRLPLLAIREVIKLMDTREIFFFSLLSKKSQNLVLLSIPRGSLSAEFTFRDDGLLFELLPTGTNKNEWSITTDGWCRIQGKQSRISFSFNNLYAISDFSSSSGSSEVEKSICELLCYFSKPFKNSKVSMKFENGTREGFAMEMMKFALVNDFSLDHIDFHLEYASSETIQELLDGCNKPCISLEIESKVPDGFKCTPPPGGYKFESLVVFYAHWVNLDDFLQSRGMFLVREFPDLTVEYLNGLLRKIANMECRLERFIFKLKAIQPSDFAEIVRGLSESTIIQNEEWQGFQFKRKDGMKMLITLSDGYLELEEDYL